VRENPVEEGKQEMSKERYQPERMVTVPGQIEVATANGKTDPRACKEAWVQTQIGSTTGNSIYRLVWQNSWMVSSAPLDPNSNTRYFPSIRQNYQGDLPENQAFYFGERQVTGDNSADGKIAEHRLSI
jgi:hypothetical protein